MEVAIWLAWRTAQHSLQSCLGNAPVGGKDDTHPVEGVGRGGRHDAIERDLAADQKDQQCDASPQHLLTKW